MKIVLRMSLAMLLCYYIFSLDFIRRLFWSLKYLKTLKKTFRRTDLPSLQVESGRCLFSWIWQTEMLLMCGPIQAPRNFYLENSGKFENWSFSNFALLKKSDNFCTSACVTFHELYASENVIKCWTLIFAIGYFLLYTKYFNYTLNVYYLTVIRFLMHLRWDSSVTVMNLLRNSVIYFF
jgi:hypothetical protein